MKSLMRNLGIPNMITATNCEQSGVIGEGPGGDTAGRECKGRIECWSLRFGRRRNPASFVLIFNLVINNQIWLLTIKNRSAIIIMQSLIMKNQKEGLACIMHWQN